MPKHLLAAMATQFFPFMAMMAPPLEDIIDLIAVYWDLHLPQFQSTG